MKVYWNKQKTYNSLKTNGIIQKKVNSHKVKNSQIKLSLNLFSLFNLISAPIRSSLFLVIIILGCTLLSNASTQKKLSHRNFAPTLHSSTNPLIKSPPFHLDLEMTGEEYLKLEESNRIVLSDPLAQSLFDDIFATGKRNLDWVKKLNQNRPTPISFSTPETQKGYPITEPRIYNPTLIRESYVQLQNEMPIALKQIIFGSDPLPTELPTTVEEYIFWGLKTDRVYQIAARWRTMEPFMDHLRESSYKDIRGYYFLTTTPGYPEALKNWDQIVEKETVKLWLKQVCVNNIRNARRCQNLLEQSINSQKTFEFFNSHRTAASEIISGMMDIPNGVRFSKTQWLSDDVFSVPFVDPNDNSIKTYLSDNIQLEWKQLPFSLLVDFVPRNQFGVEVIWQPGVTPHVPGLGSNKIFMDSNAPISEYDVQWTIRHEFGHVLGFPDCYTEFYDDSLQAIVGYQLDITDLMCSRSGHLKPRHVTELKKIYR